MPDPTEVKTQEVTTVSSTVPEQVVKTTTKVTPPQPAVEPEHPQKVYDKKKTIFRTYQIVWYILVFIEILLGFRMALKALGANSFSAFTNFIYIITDPLALPFSGILRMSASEGSVFEWSTIIAALVYFLIAFGIIHLMQLVKPVDSKEVERTVDNT